MIQVVNLYISRPNLRQILLIKRTKEPYKGLWGMPGGKIENEERADLAGARELREETGIKQKPRFPIGTCYERVWENGKVLYEFNIRFFEFVTRAETNKRNVEGELKWFRISDLERPDIIPSDPKMIQAFCLNGKHYATSGIRKENGKYVLESFCEEAPEFRKIV